MQKFLHNGNRTKINDLGPRSIESPVYVFGGFSNTPRWVICLQNAQWKLVKNMGINIGFWRSHSGANAHDKVQQTDI